MSQKCEKLHEILKAGKAFDAEFVRGKTEANRVLFAHGIYIFYEKGETGHGGDRIVRIGRAIGDSNNLYSRTHRHFYGNKDGSVFRKHIGRAILCDEPKRLENWNIKRKIKGYESDPETEEKVSKYLAENCYFVAIAIKDTKKAEELEKKMTATVAKCTTCNFSSGWLGKKSPVGEVSRSGLWQTQNLGGDELSEDDFREIKENLLK